MNGLVRTINNCGFMGGSPHRDIILSSQIRLIPLSQWQRGYWIQHLMIYPSEMKILDLVYRFFRPLHLKRFAIGLAITHLFRCNGQKNRIDQKPVSSLPMGIYAQYKRILITWTANITLLYSLNAFSAPHFHNASPIMESHYDINSAALCATAKQTLDYLNRGTDYDPDVIHPGKIYPISLSRVKATLQFICQNQDKLNNPEFLQTHFDFIRWQPDIQYATQFSASKPLLKNIPNDRILMTKYYVHLAKASTHPSTDKPYAIYALPADEQNLTIEQANRRPDLIRFHYGKQAILAGALNGKNVPVLAYVSRDDLESALMQGTIIADFGGAIGTKTLNVDRNNAIAYDRVKPPYEQNRYWYFKRVDGIKGYGKDSEHKITIQTGVTFAADLAQLGLGKLLMVQYAGQSGVITRAGILADTGGAFANNLYQVDYLAGSYQGKEAYLNATRHLPDYVSAYLMVLKKKYV